MKRDGNSESLWQITIADSEHAGDVVPDGQLFDVIIAGAGITGISTGLQLQKAGKSVLIAEAHNIGFGTTGGTTAHLNTFPDTPYHVIRKKFSDEDARLVAEAVRQSLQMIKDNVKDYNIDCSYRQVPAYLFSQDEKQSEELEEIFKGTTEAGVKCDRADDIPIPSAFENAIYFPGQACFHPLRYVSALADEFKKAGGVILENCRITGLEEGEPHIIRSDRGNFKAVHFIYATHIPPGVNLLHFRCAPYRSYAIAVQLEKDQYPDALVYDLQDPYHYYRTQEIDGELYFIAGGEDHKTGHESNTENCFRKLEAHIEKYFRVTEVINRWSSQYYEPTDGLPYIGHLPGHENNVYVATGYGGNGMVYSGVAAILLTDLIVEGKSIYEETFDPNRIKLVAGFSNFVKEAADVVGLLGKKLLIPSDKLDELTGIAPGEAKVVRYEGQTIAVYKDEAGEIYALNSACTHIKCEVVWNNAERTWDCPCHGSRFSYTGEMLTAPARKDLATVEILSDIKH